MDDRILSYGLKFLRSLLRRRDSSLRFIEEKQEVITRYGVRRRGFFWFTFSVRYVMITALYLIGSHNGHLNYHTPIQVIVRLIVRRQMAGENPHVWMGISSPY
jgi:hypothetical protein